MTYQLWRIVMLDRLALYALLGRVSDQWLHDLRRRGR